MPEDLLKVYTYNIRLVLEYAAQVWQDIPAYTFLMLLNPIQRRALRIIFPNSSYQQAPDQANSLEDRRIFICKKLMVDIMRNESHPIYLS